MTATTGQTCGDRRGTLTGFSRHKRADEDPCMECHTARRAYERDHKQRSRAAGRVAPESAHTRAQHRHYIAARGRALSRLADAHPQQMAELLAAELAEGDTVVRQPWKWKAA